LTLLQDSLELLDAIIELQLRLGDSTTNDRKSSIRSLSGKSLRDQAIQPSSGDSILFERLELEELDEVLDGMSEITSNRQLLQSHDHVLPRL